ncbi:MAG TPA: hypothetical protein VFQ39_04705, partial [Longimicrobium sp.]|nr:hypothetical protein [Longimicrobium sp.]
MNVLPSRRLLILLAAASALFLLSTGVALAVDAFLLLAFAADALWAPGAATLAAERRSPRRIALGATGEVEVVLENRGERSARVRLTDDLPDILAREGGDVLETVVPPRRDERLLYRVKALRRGDVVFGDLHLRTLGPL